MELRQAGMADLDVVMALETSGFPTGIVEERVVFARRITAFPEGFLLAGDPAWGYFCAEIWSDWSPESSDTDRDRFNLGHDIEAYLDRGGRTLYIASMAVAPEVRGMGQGRNLFQRSLEVLQGRFPSLRNAVLIVNEHWTSARKIYAGEDFIETRRMSDFFHPEGGPVGAAVVMERGL